MTGPSLEDEVTFLIGVDQFNKVAATASRHLERRYQPAGLRRPQSNAIKVGQLDARDGRHRQLFLHHGVGLDQIEEKAAWKGGMELWSAVANITFTEAASDSVANFKIVRGTDRGAHATLVRARHRRSIGARHDPDAGRHRLGRLDRHQLSLTFGPIGQTLAAKGGHPLSTVVHEIGHIIGIGHGGPYNADVNPQVQQFSEYDTMLWTLMSYIRPETTGTKFFNELPRQGNQLGLRRKKPGDDVFLTSTSR